MKLELTLLIYRSFIKSIVGLALDNEDSDYLWIASLRNNSVCHTSFGEPEQKKVMKVDTLTGGIVHVASAVQPQFITASQNFVFFNTDNFTARGEFSLYVHHDY
jgi:hypothetical protein